MNYIIIVNDNGELKTISATEIDSHNPKAGMAFEAVISTILDIKALVVQTEPTQNGYPRQDPRSGIWKD